MRRLGVGRLYSLASWRGGKGEVGGGACSGGKDQDRDEPKAWEGDSDLAENGGGNCAAGWLVAEVSKKGDLCSPRKTAWGRGTARCGRSDRWPAASCDNTTTTTTTTPRATLGPA